MTTDPAPAIPPISQEERAQRAQNVFEHLPAGTDAAVLFDDQFIQYYAGFAFHATERPIALLLLPGGERHLFVPRLEREHAQAFAQAEQVVDYPEYPGDVHPMQRLAAHLKSLGLDRGRIGVDHDGYPAVMGYSGPAVSEVLPDATILRVSPGLDAQMALKSPAELALIRESVRWGDHAHRLLQQYTEVGASETDVEARATREATAAMVAAIGEQRRTPNRWLSGAVALYRGQIGAASALPHAMTSGVRFQAGDTLVTGAGAGVGGYISELERTMFMGEPTAEQRTFFAHMLALQDIAFDALRPGATCASVDVAVQAYVDQEGLQAYWRHHVGHGLGQRIHEAPFLDRGDPRVLQPGMVLSVEPGLYVPNLGGFRHSDTILVTESGMELLTFYPRQLDDLIIH
ncbi:aminopeptidase P family protein [Deinococcus sp. KSM4-11]|uniref:M24 family metallopeptidase n=1 Tax=Deinococcus sp. KSM4-11 TaxID=2568654 RepID=UPI0010A54CD9|nr:Xaa-Pro peptidase family protein [Deinococcus sp. KSM4-11]THF86033.1 aminopeptidase P family protein [Deinococcus sp. KSM4-11]